MTGVYLKEMERTVNKRKASIDILEDNDLYFKRYGTSNPDMQRIEINYVSLDDIQSTDELDTESRNLWFEWEGKP